MATPPLISGFDLRPVEWPEGTQVLKAPPPRPALPNLAARVKAALEEPLGQASLPTLLRPHSRVTVVLDDLCYPAPAMENDCRRDMLSGTLSLLHSLGIKAERTRVLVANGLNRQWTPGELTDFLGPQAQSAQVKCHDAEEVGGHVRVDGARPWELSRALVESDVVVYLNVATMPLQAGLSSLVLGTSHYRTVRELAAPAFFDGPSPLSHGSPMQQLHDEVGRTLASKTPVFQVSAVLNNELWDARFSGLLDNTSESSRRIVVWNALPEAVRHRAVRLMKSRYQPWALFAGAPGAVAPKVLEAFTRQHEVSVQGESDIVLFGVPDVGPHSFGASQNPVLAAHLGLGLLSQFVTSRPLLRQGGVLILANPLRPSFDTRVHLPHQEFYERVLRHEREPVAIAERFEPYFAGRPEFVLNYQKRFAFHGTHPLYAWYQCTPARRRAGKIIVAYGDPRSCARLGFMPANDIDDALLKAREFLGQEKPRLTALNLPPPFFVNVR